jgi:hypothetical protein
MDSALPTVYALRGNNLRKKIKGKKNSCPNSTEKCRKIPTHDITPFLQGFPPEHP